MKLRYLFLFLSFTILTFSQSSILSENSEISIITIGQGKELNDSFGHSAIRVFDKANNLDIIYNYGLFDFNEPNFYIKFMRGKLLYSIGKNNTSNFFRFYIKQNRSIREQILDLTLTEKQEYFNFLEHNLKPENAKYLYDFFFDNCATKLREVTSKALVGNANFKDDLLQSNLTFRDLIYQKLDNQIWGKFGIDIALGSVIDRIATPKETTFLPDYVFENFKNANRNLDGKELPLVKKTNYLYKIDKKKIQKNNPLITPMSLFFLIGLIVLFITLKNHKTKKQSKWLDFIILFTTGLIGLLVVFLWFFTDHKATGNNYNILWAFMPNLVVSFYVFKEPKFLKKYYMLLLMLLFVTVIFWILKIQIFNIALLPILLFLAIRYLQKIFI